MRKSKETDDYDVCTKGRISEEEKERGREKKREIESVFFFFNFQVYMGDTNRQPPV